MDRELLGLLFLAFVPGMVIVVVGTVTAIRKYGAVFLWCLRLEPVRDRLTALLRDMQAPHPVPVEVQRDTIIEIKPAAHVAATCGKTNSVPPNDPFLRA
jgi:hypothetical protein